MIAVRAPDHLGDAVMALPAVDALAGLGPVELWSRGRWAPDLYGDRVVAVHVGDGPPAIAERAVLLKPSLHAAFSWRGLPTVGIGAGWPLHNALPAREEHRRDGFARLAAAAGATVSGPPAYRRRGRAPALPDAFVGINPWSPTATVRWPRFGALVDALEALGRPVVIFAGPGEGTRVGAEVGGRPVVEGLSLPDFAAALDGCSVFVSCDSGAAHFAAACGRDVVVVHGSTSAARTGVGRPVTAAALWCQPCYRKTCLWGRPCLDRVGVQQVIEALA